MPEASTLKGEIFAVIDGFGVLLNSMSPDELVLLLLCVAPLLLALRPLANAMTGMNHDREEGREAEQAEATEAVNLARRTSLKLMEPAMTGLEEAGGSLESRLDRYRRVHDADWEAVQHDVAGVAWELLRMRSTLGAEETRATLLPQAGRNGEGHSTRNMSALARARGARKLSEAGRSAAEDAGPETVAPTTTAYINGEKVSFSSFDALWSGPRPTCVRGPSGKLYQGTSLAGLGPAHEPRRSAIWLVESRPFDPLILLTIAANCTTMAWASPLDPPGTYKATFLDVLEWVYLAIFTFELATKVVAYGLVADRESYLRDAWCQLDFVVVSLAWLPILFPDFGNFNVIRAVRALRPLRALKRMPGMPKLVGCVLASLPKLANVGTLCAFIFLVFGIVGVELFKGAMHYRCAAPGFEPASAAAAGALAPTPFASAAFSPEAAASQADFETGDFCEPGAAADACGDEGAFCAYFEANPVADLSHFDTISYASIAILQCASFDAWTVGMYVLMNHFSSWVWLYHCLIVVFGGFFVVNLFLAILLEEFLSAAQEEDAQKALEDAKEDAEEAIEAIKAARESPPTSPGASPLILPAPEAEGCCDCAPAAGGGRALLARLVTASWFGHGSTFLVVLNLVIMCMPYAGQSDEYAADLESAGTAITLLFMAEMGLKLVGLGCAGYWRDGWNVLDGTIVIISFFDLALTIAFAGGGPNISFLRILRMLRMLRILRLMRVPALKGILKICTTLYKALPQTSNVLILFFLIAFIFALLGMQLFGGSFEPRLNADVDPDAPPELPRTHFDYAGPALLTVFIIMSGSWFDIMMAQEEVVATAPLFFVAVLVVGTYLLLNIFVTILLESFADDDDDDGEGEGEKEGGEGEGGKTLLEEERAIADVVAMAAAKAREEETGCCAPERSCFLFGRSHPLRRLCTAVVTDSRFDWMIIGLIIVSSVCLAIDTPRLDPESSLALGLEQLNTVFTIAFTCEMTLKIVALGFVSTTGAYLKDPWNVLDFFIVNVSLVVLFANGVPQLQALRSLRTLRVLRPLRLLARDPGMRLIISTGFKVMPSVLNVFGVLLAVTTVFAILGMQLFMDSLGSCTDETITERALCGSGVTVGRRARALSLGMGGMGMGMGMGGGDDGDGDGGAATVGRALRGGGGGGGGGGGESEFDAAEGAVWLNPSFGSFDDFPNAMLLLYIMSTLDGWEDVMFVGMDAVGPGAAPQRNDFSSASLFFVAWIFFGGFFALNLFVGAIVDNFTRIKAETDGSATMTAGQQQWVNTLKEMQTLKAARAMKPPDGPFRRRLYELVTSRAFDLFITCVILANVLLMASDYWRIEEDKFFATYTTAMAAFAYVYYVEAALKIPALGLSYFRDNWCRFDFFLVCTTALDQFAAELLEHILPLPPMLLRVLRVLRILRILRLLKDKRAKGLRDLLMTLVLSFPSLVNVGSLLALLLFMYAVLGVQLFTYVQHGDPFDDDRNFDTFGNALLLLFQALTGDDWAALMHGCMITPGDSGCTLAAGDCGSSAAVAYFVSFQFLGSFVLLNLVVAVILENFTSLGHVNPDLVSSNDIANFREARPARPRQHAPRSRRPHAAPCRAARCHHPWPLRTIRNAPAGSSRARCPRACVGL